MQRSRAVIRNVLDGLVMLRVVTSGRIRWVATSGVSRNTNDFHRMAILVQEYLRWKTGAFWRTCIPVAWGRIRRHTILYRHIFARRNAHRGLVRILWIPVVDTGVPRKFRFWFAFYLRLRSLLLVEATTLFLVPLISPAL
jgi:hypothetical protein